MMTTQGERLLAALEGETARAWEDFAALNQVSLGALLDALGPILHDAALRNVDLRDVLVQAVDAAT